MRCVCIALLLAAFALTVGCGGKDGETADPKVEPAAEAEPEPTAEAKPEPEPGVEAKPEPEKGAMPESIGSAKMKEDGTIVLQLRAEGPGGMIGDALITYKPDDPKYKKTLEHLGGLKPGEEKPVPPWPEKEE